MVDTKCKKLHFKSYDLNFESPIDTNILTECCKISKNSKSVSKNSDYSIGKTYFIGSKDSPKCCLESLALAIFNNHTSRQIFNPDNSGAEWWVQVIDARDDIGFHWDRDYGDFLK